MRVIYGKCKMGIESGCEKWKVGSESGKLEVRVKSMCRKLKVVLKVKGGKWKSYRIDP